MSYSLYSCLKNVLIICSLLISANGKGITPVMSSQKNIKVAPKVLKSLKRSAAIGGAVGGSVPAIKEVFSFPDEIKTVKNRVYSENLNGDVWSYSELMTNIKREEISSVSIDQDGRYALIRERVTSEIGEDTVHYVTIIPMHITELINRLLESDINIDIIM